MKKPEKARRKIARVLFYYQNNLTIPAAWRKPGRLEAAVLEVLEDRSDLAVEEKAA